MQIYLPIAEMAVSMDMLLLMAMVVGFLSGIFGVGGGFIMTPLLMFVGIPPAIAVGTQSNQLVASSITGVLGHWRKGNVDVELGSLMLAGSIFGSVIGVFVFSLLTYLGQIDLFISLAYVVMLGAIGSMMLFESLNSQFHFFEVKDDQFDKGFIAYLYRVLPYRRQFKKSKIYCSILMPALIGFVGGLMVSIMGVGGGFILVPAMIYILRMSPMLVAGTSLFQIIFTTAFTTILHAVTNQSVDLVLGLILILGSVFGAQFGVRASRYIDGRQARFLLSVMIVAVALKLAYDLVIEPDYIYSIAVRE